MFANQTVKRNIFFFFLINSLSFSINISANVSRNIASGLLYRSLAFFFFSLLPARYDAFIYDSRKVVIGEICRSYGNRVVRQAHVYVALHLEEKRRRRKRLNDGKESTTEIFSVSVRDSDAEV